MLEKIREKLHLNAAFEMVAGKKMGVLLGVGGLDAAGVVDLTWPRVAIICAYLIGQSIADGLSKGLTSHTAAKAK